MSHVPPAESVFLDLSDRAKLRLTGADRVRFLNGQVSNDTRSATADESIYTGVMTIKGKLCADAFVHADGESLLIDAEPSLQETLAARLERYIIADDVQLEDVTAELGLLHLIDSRNADRAGGAPLTLNELPADVRRVRATRLGRPGTDLFFPAARRLELLAWAHGAGLILLNEDSAEAVRIAAGVPRWGAELDENTLPAEAGIEDRAVSYTKGCYIGQEIVSRIKSVGHVNRVLRGFRALDASPLFPGMTLFPAAEVDLAGSVRKSVGRLTSAASSAGSGGAAYLALGYVRRGWDAPGNRLLAAAEADAESVSGENLPSSFCEVEISLLPFT